MDSKRQLFVFWQFGGNNRSFCNQTCPYCYGGKKENMHYWNPDLPWEKTFEKLDAEHGNTGIYFVVSYGESMGMSGFKDVVEIVGRHPSWTLCMITNLSYDPAWLVNTRLVRDGRLFVHACWHPLGVPDRAAWWENFKAHLLALRSAHVPVTVLYLFWKPQIRMFPEYFDWLDAHDFRVHVRRFVGPYGGYRLPFTQRYVGAKVYPHDYSEAERGFLFSQAVPKVIKYGLGLVSPKGRLCSAGKDMFLVKCNGDVALCADTEETTKLGNLFDGSFKLAESLAVCPSCVCGGDYGMLHVVDNDFEPNPDRLPNEPFVSIVENLKDGHPVAYHKRERMLFWLNKIREGR